MALIDCPSDENFFCYAVCGKEQIIKTNGDSLVFPDLIALKGHFKNAILWGEEENQLSVLSISTCDTLPKNYKIKTLRSSFAELNPEECFRLARAKSLSEWLSRYKYCSRCGSALKNHDSLTARFCNTCDSLYFPTIEPCVIVLVKKENKILLARHSQRNQDVYTCIAGFVESGETAEHAVFREVLEETGIKVKNITYRGSQSWPFPDQLMLAFTADYESGDVKIQEEEILDARWFDVDNLPDTPSEGSIAFKLIHGLI